MPYFVQYCVVEKCRIPLSFKIYLFVNNVIFMKMIGKLSSFFSPRLLLMVYFDDVLHNRQAPPPAIFLCAKTKSHSRANFIQLKQSYCLCPCKFYIV